MKEITVNEVPDNNGKKIEVIANGKCMTGFINGFTCSTPDSYIKTGTCNSFTIITEDNSKVEIFAMWNPKIILL